MKMKSKAIFDMHKFPNYNFEWKNSENQRVYLYHFINVSFKKKANLFFGVENQNLGKYLPEGVTRGKMILVCWYCSASWGMDLVTQIYLSGYLRFVNSYVCTL